LHREKVPSRDEPSIHPIAQPLGKSVEHFVDPARRLVSIKFIAELTVDDIGRYSRLLQSNPSFRPDFSELVDLTQVEGLDLNAGEFLKLADEIDPFSTDAKRAFVVRTSVQNRSPNA